MAESLDRRRAPLYTLSDAARFAHVNRQTLKNWADGYEVAGRRYPALLELPASEPSEPIALSFENLVEAALIGRWRAIGIPLQRIRRAHYLATRHLGAHPFARHRIYDDGADLLVEADRDTSELRGQAFTVLSRAGQVTLGPAVSAYLRFIDWQSGEGFAYQFRPPLGRDVVKLNPEISFGLPSIRRIRTEIVAQRFLAEESIPEIAADLGLSPVEVELAVRYEWSLSQAA